MTVLDGRLVAVTGVVDEHVDAAESCLRFIHRCGDLRPVGHVEIKRQRPVPGSGHQAGHARLVAGGDHGAPAAFEHQAGQFAAETGGAAGDQPYGIALVQHREGSMGKGTVAA